MLYEVVSTDHVLERTRARRERGAAARAINAEARMREPLHGAHGQRADEAAKGGQPRQQTSQVPAAFGGERAEHVLERDERNARLECVGMRTLPGRYRLGVPLTLPSGGRVSRDRVRRRLARPSFI